MKWVGGLMIASVMFLASCDRISKATAPTDAPIITQFAADALTAKINTPVTLRWDVSGTNADVRIDPLVGNVPQVGSTTVVLAVTTTFTLNARSPAGASAQRVLTVIITP